MAGIIFEMYRHEGDTTMNLAHDLGIMMPVLNPKRNVLSEGAIE